MLAAAVGWSVFWSVVKVLAKELSPEPTFLATLVNDPDSSGSLCFKLNLFLAETRGGVDDDDDEFTTDFVVVAGGLLLWSAEAERWAQEENFRNERLGDLPFPNDIVCNTHKPFTKCFFFKILTSNHYWLIECCDDFGSIFSRVLNSKIPPALHNSRSSSENEKDSSHIVVLSQKIICLLSPLISVDIRENSFLKQLFLKSRIVMDPGTEETFGAL